MALGIVFLIVAAASYLFFSSSTNPLAAPATRTAIPVSAASLDRVSIADAFSAFESREAVFVDVRSIEEYNQSHIDGAVSIPLVELPDRIGELNPDDWIITY
jgi:hypothetical protein